MFLCFVLLAVLKSMAIQSNSPQEKREHYFIVINGKCADCDSDRNSKFGRQDISVVRPNRLELELGFIPCFQKGTNLPSPLQGYDDYLVSIHYHVMAEVLTFPRTSNALRLRDHFGTTVSSSQTHSAHGHTGPAASPTDAGQWDRSSTVGSPYFQVGKAVDEDSRTAPPRKSLARASPQSSNEANDAPNVPKGKAKAPILGQAVDVARRSTRQSAAKKPLLDPDEV